MPSAWDLNDHIQTRLFIICLYAFCRIIKGLLIQHVLIRQVVKLFLHISMSYNSLTQVIQIITLRTSINIYSFANPSLQCFKYNNNQRMTITVPISRRTDLDPLATPKDQGLSSATAASTDSYLSLRGRHLVLRQCHHGPHSDLCAF